MPETWTVHHSATNVGNSVQSLGILFSTELLSHNVAPFWVIMLSNPLCTHSPFSIQYRTDERGIAPPSGARAVVPSFNGLLVLR